MSSYGSVTSGGTGIEFASLADSGSKEFPTSFLCYPTTETDGAAVFQTVTTSAGLPVAQQGTWNVVCTNAGTFTVQVTGAALTALQLIDDVVSTAGGTDVGAHTTIIVSGTSAADGGGSGGTVNAWQVDGNGHGQIDVVSSALPSGAATAANQTTGNNLLTTIAGAVSGTEVQVDVLTCALPSGAATAANQTTGNTSLATIAGAVSGNEMQVDVLTSALPSGAATAANQTTGNGFLSTIAGAVSGAEVQVDIVSGTVAATQSGAWSAVVAGTAAHDAAVSGNPVLLGGEAQEAAVSGNNVANGDTVRLRLDKYGRVQTVSPPVTVVSDNATPITTATTTTVIAAPGAGKKLRIHYIHAHNSSATATSVSFRDGTSGTQYFINTLTQYAIFAHRINGGWDLTANTLLAITTSGAGSVNWTIEYEVVDT